jgi:hypothetical protein
MGPAAPLNCSDCSTPCPGDRGHGAPGPSGLRLKFSGFSGGVSNHFTRCSRRPQPLVAPQFPSTGGIVWIRQEEQATMEHLLHHGS